MTKIIKFRIIIFIVSILISYLLSDNYQNMLGFVLILSIGIIHGANDLLIIKKYSKKDTLRGTMSYFLYYLSFVLLGFIFFYLFPSVALLTFVLVSIYHFGEQHWEANKLSNQINPVKRFFLFIFHGSLFFIIIFINNIEIVNTVLISFNITPLIFSYLKIVLYALAFLYILNLFYFRETRKHLFAEILFFSLLFLLTINSTLIFGFAIYFIFFHSLLSIKDQVKFIYNNNKPENIKKYILSAIPYFILAIVFLILFYLLTDLGTTDILPIIFTFLAAITFPHVLVIEKMYRNMK